MKLQDTIVRAAAIAALASAATAFAEGSGITTNQFPNPLTGCNACHTGGLPPVVTLTGPTIVDTNTKNTYTLVIDSIGAQVFGGLNVASETGQLLVGGPDGSHTKGKPGTGGRAEITHSQRKPETLGQIRFSFAWKAPNVPGPATLHAWGNAVDGSGAAGDMAAYVTLPITVNQGPPIPVPASSPAAGGALVVLLAAAGLLALRRHGALSRR